MDFEQHQDIEYYPAESMKKLPFSEAVRVGNMLYLSGQIGIDDAGNVSAWRHRHRDPPSYG